MFTSILTGFITALSEASVPGIYEVVAKRALPTLSDAMANAPASESWVAATAIDLVNSLLGGAKQDNIGDGFFAVLAPSFFKCLGETDDRDVIQVSFGTQIPNCVAQFPYSKESPASPPSFVKNLSSCSPGATKTGAAALSTSSLSLPRSSRTQMNLGAW